MMTHFRKRFSKNILADINNMIVENAMEQVAEAAVEPCDEDDTPSNNGKLIVDATCTPADITYPTDLNLLNDAREKTEEIIDTFHILLSAKNVSLAPIARRPAKITWRLPNKKNQALRRFAKPSASNYVILNEI